MAFYDESGRLTIDEYAANKDIQRLQETINKLQTSLDAIKAIQREGAQMEGKAACAITDKSQEMVRKLSGLIQKLENTVSFIRRVIKRYQQIDQDIKTQIQTSAGGGGNGAFGGGGGGIR